MTRTLAIALATGLCAVAAPALAQDNSDEIVVSGERLEQPSAVRDLVQEMVDTNRADLPATRFFDALCITVSGLNEAGSAHVRTRIAAIAQDVGLPVQGEGCRNNALVLVHDDPAALIERIKREAGGLLPREERGGVEAQLAEGSQIIVWHNDEPRSVGGRPLRYDDLGGLNVQTRVSDSSWPSRSQLSQSRGVKSAVVILHADIVAGMEIDRLADYAAMRLLAPDLMPLEGEAPEPSSITAPFPEEGGPETLTRFDRAYLTALYDLPPNAPQTRLAGAVAEAYANE